MILVYVLKILVYVIHLSLILSLYGHYLRLCFFAIFYTQKNVLTPNVRFYEKKSKPYETFSLH